METNWTKDLLALRKAKQKMLRRHRKNLIKLLHADHCLGPARREIMRDLDTMNSELEKVKTEISNFQINVI